MGKKPKKKKKQRWQKLKSKLSSNVVGGNKAIPPLPINNLAGAHWGDIPSGE